MKWLLGLLGKMTGGSGMLILPIVLAATGGWYLGHRVATADWQEQYLQLIKMGEEDRQYYEEYMALRVNNANEVAQVIIDSLQDSLQNLEAKTRQSTREIIKYVPAPEDPAECRYTRGAVSLLNNAIDAANASAADQPNDTPLSATEKQTPSTLTQRALVEEYLRLVESYGELAQTHDALVSWLKENYPGKPPKANK